VALFGLVLWPILVFGQTPNITSVTPTTATAGTQVTIAGSGFGASQGSGNAWVGSMHGVVVSWSDTQVVATVASGSKTGVAQILQGGVWSNSVPFTIGAADFVPTAGTMSSARYGQTATQLNNGNVLFAGGMDGTNVLSTTEIYSLRNQTFASGGGMTLPRWSHTATLLNDGTVLIVAGSNLTNETPLNSAELYDPVGGTFTLLSATLNTARVGHTATLLASGQVLVVGGYDPTTGIIADAELYDPTAQVFIDLGNTNTPRFHHTATLLQNGQVLITGGETDPTPSGAYSNAEIFDPTTWTFSTVSTTMASAREGHAATLLNDGTVLLTGGNLPGAGSLSTAEIYSPSSGTFTAISAPMTSPRVFHDATLLNGGKVLLSRGQNDSGGTSSALNSAELYDPTSHTFTAVPSTMNSARTHQTATLLNDGTVLEAGGTDGTNVFNTAEVYGTSKLVGLTSISISPASPSVPLGSQQMLTATGTFNDGRRQSLSSVLWSSSSPSVATTTNDASNSGFASTFSQGTATITATAGGISGTTTLMVPAPSLIALTVSPATLTMPLGAIQQFTATGTYSDGSTKDLTSTATWTSLSPSLVVNGAGLAAATATGSGTIQASFGSQTSSSTVTVGAPALVSLVLTPPAASILKGTTQQYVVTGTYTDGSTQNLTTSVSWSGVPTTTVSVTSSGLATGIGSGNAVISVRSGTIVAVATLAVGGISPTLVSITVLPNVATVPLGTNQQFSATGTYTDGSTQDLTSSVTWATSNPTAVGITSSGLASALTGGTSTITASSGAISGAGSLTVETNSATLNTSRYQHSATLLNNGAVLVAGGITCPSSGSCTYLNSAELYTPNTGTFAITGGMATARSAPAVLLGSGKVLIAGGFSCDSNGNCTSLRSAEIYDPASGTFSGAGNMTINRDSHTMTLLNSGRVLIAGGQNCTSATSCSALNSAEIYDPVAGTFTATGSLNAARFNASVIALNSGQVLIAGGFNGMSYPAAAEIYDPVGGAFTIVGNLNTPRALATATMLESGNVMIAGGTTCGSPLCPTASVEVYEGGLFTNLSPNNYPLQMHDARVYQTTTPLTSGQILIAGGYNSCNSTTCTSDSTSESVTANSGWFFASQPLASPRSGHTATLLTDGSVLLIGGINNGITLSSTDSFQPASLDVPGMSSLAINPPNAPVSLGTTLKLAAIGGTVYVPAEFGTLPAVIWNSSSPSVATVTNALGSAGVVNALSLGTTTITASVGSVSTTTQITVTAPLVSITVTPSDPSIPLYSTPQVQFTATGIYADGSSRDLTADATWASSNSSIALMLPNQTNPGLAALASVGSTSVSASFGGTSSSTTLTITPSTVPPLPVQPTITAISPASGYAGTQVTISGSGFGASQNSGTLLLGSTLGLIASWSNTQIVAIVSAGSTSGVAQVQQNGLSSNTVQFTVNPVTTIANVFPNNGLPGTQVTINGSGFGAAQGTGNVWLGTAPAIVNSWSNGQVVATVAAGATTGNAQILQNGGMSNAIAFTVNLPHITAISPNNGADGTVVTVTGSGFGATQGNGTVWIGSTPGSVVGWSDAQIVASVASGAVSGIVQVEQNGASSNTLTFTVPPSLSSGSSATQLVPAPINMVVGGTQSIQALDSDNLPVTGLAWTSSNTEVVSLSADDPPIITAVGVGTSMVTAGGASAKVTVWAGPTLPTGTPFWSNPGDGAGVSCIVPAVPSSTGVTDVFALNADGNVQAITSAGLTAWTANVGSAVTCSNLIPDFQGGLVIATSQSIYRLDGMTGQPSTWTYTSASGSSLSTPVVHTSGPIFTIDGSSVVSINPATGQTFSVAMEPTMSNGAPAYSPPGPSSIGNLIIAGDGYAYVPYQYSQGTSAGSVGVSTSSSTSYLNVLRVGPGGDSSEIAVKQWSQSSSQVTTVSGYIPFGTPYVEIIFGAELHTQCGFSDGCPTSATVNFSDSSSGASAVMNLITNADQGVLLSFQALEGSQSQTTDVWCYAPGCPNEIPSDFISSTSSYNPGVTNSYLATISSGGGVSLATLNLPGQSGPIQPVLQRADGSYIGTVWTSGGSAMMAFTASGQPLWSQPNDTPQIATQGGGVIGSSGTTYDQNGNANGQAAGLGGFNWLGRPNTYASSSGSVVAQLLSPLNVDYTSFDPSPQANPSNGTAVQQCAALPSTASDLATQAYSDVRDFLSAMNNGKPKNCPSCDAEIFRPLKMKRTDFVTYLQQKPVFCDGTKTTNISASTVTNDPKYKDKTIAQYFQAESPDAATEPNGPSSPLYTFFNPDPNGTYTITHAGNGPTYDKAVLFHESLHGYTRLPDSALAPPGLCEILVPTKSDCSSRTIDITFFIEDLAWPLP
jgi:hypothetical protein